jgi:hypothetical protein
MEYLVVCSWGYWFGKSVNPQPLSLDVSFELGLYPHKDQVDTFVGLRLSLGFAFSWSTPISFNHYSNSNRSCPVL